MSLRRKIRNIMKRSPSGELLFYKIRILREKIAMTFISDEKYVKTTYRKRFGREINLAEPATYTEKLQWLKLFYRNEAMPQCSDKYAIRDYLREHGREELCNEVIGVYENAKDIDFDALPQKFVAKANHGSGWNLICRDKSALKWKYSVKTMNTWMKLNLYTFGREWNYRYISPKIVIEKFIEHEPLNDYKFMCFNGEPLYMQLNNDFEGTHYVDFYELSTWTHVPFSYGPYNMSNRTVEKPEQFDRMMELARELSKPFPFVRVDFYSFDETIILGELTFFPGGGLWPLIPNQPEDYDVILGKYLQLPEPNHNLELLKKIKREAKNEKCT